VPDLPVVVVVSKLPDPDCLISLFDVIRTGISIRSQPMKKSWLLLAVAMAVAGALVYNWRACLLLPWLERKLERQFEVDQIDSDSLAILLAAGQDDLLLLDTRSAAECRVSRIEGALRVDWQVDKVEFVSRYGAVACGRKVVLYCSVGYRSSAMLQRLDRSLKDIGVTGAANLSGGIFNWYNLGQTVVDSDGTPTDSIHTYDKSWSHYVKLR